MTGQPVTWTGEKLALLKKAYAENQHAKSFKITVQPEGELTFLPDYAKYVIEYLEGEFAGPQPTRRPDNEGDESYTPGSGSWEGEYRQ
jgi:hypothetical protein